MSFKFTDETCRSLVEARFPGSTFPPNALFVTISPNPETKHVYPRHLKTMMRYDRLPQRIQYQYCIHALKSLLWFNSAKTICIGTWELNEKKNVHLHVIIMDPEILNDSHLSIYQREVSVSKESLRNMKKNKNAKDWMHNICFIDKTKEYMIQYFDKDYEKNKNIFSNYYCDSTDIIYKSELEPMVEDMDAQNYLFKIII